MLRQISMLVALLMSYAVMQAGHSAIGALVTHQGSAVYQFSETMLGAMLALTYLGFVIGNYVVRYLLPRISYIRTFSVCAALLAVVTMVYPIFPTIEMWLALRFIHGVFFSCTVVLCDGWFNSSVPNESRSRYYSLYMTVAYIAYGLGNYILIVESSAVGAAFSYSYVAMLMILSLIPLCLTRFAEPQFTMTRESGGGMRLIDVYRIAPIAVIGHLFVGMIQGASFLFIRYADSITDDAAAAANLAAIFFAAGFLLQLPAGWLFDRMGEKRTLMGGVYLATMAIAAALFFGQYLSYEAVYVLLLLYSAIAGVSYPLNIVYGQNFIEAEKSALYSGRMFQMYATGAIAGPFIAGLLMEHLSLAWLFGFCAIAAGTMGAATLTSRIMPKYRVAGVTDFHIRSAHVPRSSYDHPIYNEYDVGPQLPDDHNTDDAAADAAADVGPPIPENAPLGLPEDEAKATDASSPEFGVFGDPDLTAGQKIRRE